MNELNRNILVRCFLRCYLIGSAFNTRGLQNIGLVYVMLPGLKQLHAEPRKLALALRRYARHYNTHPFWTPLLAGIFLKLEERIAKGLIPPETLENVKTTTTYTLSALGDSFFSASLTGLWALTAGCLIAAGEYWLTAVLALALFSSIQLFRAATFWYGYQEGFRVLTRLKRWDLINWGRRIKVFNAGLLLAFWILIAHGELTSLGWLCLLAVLGVYAYACGRRALARELVLGLAAAGGIFIAVLRGLGG